MSSMSFVCTVFALMICGCCADLCFDWGKIKFENDTKLQCVNGTWTATACMADNDEQMADGEIKAQEPYLVQCQKRFSDVMKLVVIGCSMKGRILAPSQTYETSDSYFKCNHALDGKISLDVAGCVVYGKRVPLGDLTQIDSTVYRCVQADSKSKLELVGCAHEEHTVKLNEKFVGTDYWYTCDPSGKSEAKLTIKGCVNDKLVLASGDVFYKQAVIYECAQGKSGLQAKAVGCLEVTATNNFVEHAVGDKWDEVEGQYQCLDTGRSVSKVRLS